jgi:hypothetical protein
LRPPRNPFRLRAAEQIDDDWTFLSLCEPGLFGLLPEDGLWDRRVIVRSSAGGGKTTLLRLFTPTPLRLLHSRGRREPVVSQLYREVQMRGALDKNGPKVAGALLSLAGKYAPLDQLTSVDPGRRLRWFLALLNARVLLAGLRAHLELAGLRYPNDLQRLRVLAPSGDSSTIKPELPASGTDVYEWARTLELRVAAALSSLGPPDETTVAGDDELTCLEILGRGVIEIDGAIVKERTVVLLDDVHRLSRSQRSFLLDTLIARRSPTPVWIAERREGLTPSQLLSTGSREDRDSVTVDIEEHWRGPRRGAFQRLALGVADRRVQLTPDIGGGSFAPMLVGADEQPYASILDDVERRLYEAAGGRREFGAWIESRLDRHDNARDQAIDLRALQIRIERELAATQMSLDVLVRDEELLDELDKKREASNVREAAELFLCTDYELPYFFGAERLSQLASANIDQFLDLAGDLFEELSGAAVLRRNVSLAPARQQQILKAAVTEMWRRLATSIEDGARIRSLLDGVGQYAAERTYRPNAPYAPGVTGVALRLSEAEQLEVSVRERGDSWQAELGRMLATLLAHNLVTVNHSEAKGQRWAVYYLNRAWCVRYELPLGFGGWQPVSAEMLYSWSRGDRVRTPQRTLAA